MKKLKPDILHSVFKLFGKGALALSLALGSAHAASSVTITDPKDLGDVNGDIRSVRAQVMGDYMILNMSVEGLAGPTIEQTAEGMVNRYYYHWLIDTDNNPATGRSNAEYEGTPTGLTRPIGTERVVMLGWRDGKPNGIEVYDPADEDTAILSGFTVLPGGNSLTAIIPLSALGVVKGQTIAVSAFQEGASEGWVVDWVESATMTVEGPDVEVASVNDPKDIGDSSGDIRSIGGYALGDHLFLSMTVDGVAAPFVSQTPEGMVNRYYYHWLLDTDNNPATGRSNAEYEGTPTGLASPIGAERVIMLGWRDGKPNGVAVYDPLNEETPTMVGFPFQARGNTIMAVIPFSALGVNRGQTVALSAFQEGASEGWVVDWVESARISLDGPNPPIAVVADSADLPDTSGDIRSISAHVVGDELRLSMTVGGLAAPAIDATPEGKVNRYYYHWLLDTDNNPATGRSNAEYEGTPTGLARPLGAERVIMIGWRDGKPNGVEVYDPADEDTALASNFPFSASGNTITASIPLSALGLVAGQTIAVSAFQEGASDGWLVDWLEAATLSLETGVASGAPVVSIDDPQDLPDSSGDIRRVEATVAGTNLVLRMFSHGIMMPSVEETPEGKVNRYYYHWLLDTDNNPATGRSNAEYEGTPTGLAKPLGAELVVMIGWRNGAPNGLEVYNPADEDTAIISDFEFTRLNGGVEVKLPLAQLGLVLGQTIAFSAFQEGASDGWLVDWVEAKTITLSEGALPTLTLDYVFTGNAYGFEIKLTDSGTNIANATSVQTTLDGAPVAAQVSKTGNVTTIVGKHPALLEGGTIHTLGLTLKVGGADQSRNFVFEAPRYTVLPLAGRLQTPAPNSRGFNLYMTMISSMQADAGIPSVHSNIAARAEMQLRGEMKPEGSDIPYSNETDFVGGGAWKGPVIPVEGVINWTELAPDFAPPINFTGDEPIPSLFGNSEGVVAEITTYLELTQGAHKFGIFSEGGHKVNAGLDPAGPVLSVFDNADGVARVPTYFARNQFFDVVAPVDGIYPIRFLWFQSRRGQEQGGLILELFSVTGQTLHLINDSSDPLAIKAYRSGTVIAPGSDPTVGLTRTATGISLSYTGQLEATDRLNGGTWTVIGQPNQSPMTVPADGAARFFRARRAP